MAGVDVVLRIGSKMGPGGLASLQAGLQMVREFGGAIADSVVEADKFALSMRHVDMALVNMADSAAAGQIDTGVIIKQLAAFKEAAPGVELTAKQIETMSARAAHFAEVSGKDATEVFERMTNGIMRAESEALKPFGIKLKENADMAVTQTQAIRELTDGFEDFEYQAKTNVQRMSALNNNWDTFKNLLFASVGELPGVAEGLNAINQALAETNEALSETSESVKEYVWDLRNLGTAFMFLNNIAMGNLPAAAAEFKGFIDAAMNDAKLRAGHAWEMRSKMLAEISAEQDRRTQYISEPWKGGAGGGGGGGGGRAGDTGSDEPGSGISFYDVAEDEFSGTRYGTQKAGKLGYGGPGVASGRFSDIGSIQASVDARLAEEELLRIEAQRFDLLHKTVELQEEEMLNTKERIVDAQAQLALLESEEYQQMRLAELREEDNVRRAEDNIIRLYEQERALDFAQEFRDVWIDALDGLSAGAMAATSSMDLLRQSWGIVVKAAISGKNNIGEAVRVIVEKIGTGLAIEAGWRALMEAANAVAAGAKRQYGKMAKHVAAAGMYTALAGVAGAAAGVASRLGGSSGGGSGISTGGSQSTFSPEYGGGYMAGRDDGPQEHVFVFKVDDRGLFTMVQEGNTRARRSGEPSFRVEAA